MSDRNSNLCIVELVNWILGTQKGEREKEREGGGRRWRVGEREGESILYSAKQHNTNMHFYYSVLCKNDFDVSLIAVFIKRFQYIGIFYCFSNFGTILIIIKRFQYIRIFYCFSNFGTNLIKRFRILRNLLLFFEFRYYPFYY